MTDFIPTKHCSYCKRWHPQNDFFKIAKGKWGQIIVAQCGNCYRARQNKEANQVRFDIMVANEKASNRRAFGYFDKEKIR